MSQTGKSCPATEKHSACLDDGSSLRWSRQTASRSESHGLAPSGHDAGIVSLMQSSPHDGSSPRRSHQTASRSESHGLAPSGHDAGIVSLMLSSPHTLLVMSLTKGNHAQASQVIKVRLITSWHLSRHEWIKTSSYVKVFSKLVMKTRANTKEAKQNK